MCLIRTLSVAAIVLFFLGNFWVYITPREACDSNLYNATLWLLITQYVVVAISLCCACSCACASHDACPCMTVLLPQSPMTELLSAPSFVRLDAHPRKRK